MVNKKYPFHVLEDPKVEKTFNDHLLGLIKSFDYVTLTVVIDKWEHVQRYQEWHRHPYQYCLMVSMERYARWLERRGAVGDVMAEARGKKEDQRLRREFAHESLRTFGSMALYLYVQISCRLVLPVDN